MKLFSEFSELGGLGELDQEAIAKAVLVKHGETEIAEFGRAMGIALIEVSYEVDELGFKLW